MIIFLKIIFALYFCLGVAVACILARFFTRMVIAPSNEGDNIGIAKGIATWVTTSFTFITVYSMPVLFGRFWEIQLQ
jgi:hypothetical protein